jgi:hypothetical protein
MIHRRTLLKGMLGGSLVTLGLPPLELFFDRAPKSRAAAGGFPRRLGVFFWGNGNIPQLWEPRGDGADWTPSPQLEPLAPVKDKVSVVTGTVVPFNNRVPHGTGLAGVLTGADLTDIRGDEFTMTRPTLDQVAAAAIGRETRFRSLEVAVIPSAGFSHNGPRSVNPAESSPARLFDRLFNPDGGFRAPGTDAPPDPKLHLRRSVLDAVRQDASRLARRLGARDAARLDQHLTGVRELEQRIARLEAAPPSLAACRAPMAPRASFPDIEGRPQIAEISGAIIELLAMALACDQTRVFSLFFCPPLADTLFLDLPQGHHQLTHDEGGDQPQVHRIVRFVMGELARLLQRFDAVEEGDGTLLDHLSLLATSDLSFGRTHSIEEYPILVCGGSSGALKAGVHVKARGEPVSRVGLSLLRAVGVPQAEFGDGPARVTDGIAGLEP